MRTAVRIAVVAALLLALVPAVTPPTPVVAQGQVAVFMPGLNIPIALAFASDGRIFFAERNTGNIQIIEAGAVLPAPFYTLTNTNFAGERGLLGLALHPNFPATPYVYAYQTYNDVANGTVHNRIVRITASGNVGTAMQVLLKMPALSGATNHNGGVIGFGPDGKLYAVVGENANIALAQNMLSPMGKVLRMNDDGSVPTDNPFFGNTSVEQRIFTYGHRNMFGLAFHPFTNRTFVTENGPGCNDEINLLVPGGNFAWGTTQTCTSPPLPPTNTNQDGPQPRQPPLLYWTPTICPTNAAIYVGSEFPQWQGDMIMGDCNTRRLHRLDLVGPSYDSIASDTTLYTAPAYIMDVELGPDGAIWFTTPTTIYRYFEGNQPPVAAFTATPPITQTGNAITFDATASTDPDGLIANYSWDFGDTTTGFGALASHSYALPGTYNVTLTVADNESRTDSVTHPVGILAPGSGPVARFTIMPSPALPGANVTFNATASSDAGGTIVSYSWDFGDNTTGTGVVAMHAYASPRTYTVTLTVVDNMSFSDNATQQLLVDAPPVADFTVTPPSAYPNAPISFDASGSTDPDGTIVSYAWDFGDGTSATVRAPPHTYTRHGTFTVVLTVTDDLGLSDTATRSVLIGNRPPVIAARTPTGNTSQGAGQARPFAVTASDPDGDLLTYEWRVDGTIRGVNASAFDYTEAVAGVYTVNVTVRDGFGGFAWTEWTVTVTPASTAALDGWWLAVPLVLAAFLVLLLVLWRRRRRPRADS